MRITMECIDVTATNSLGERGWTKWLQDRLEAASLKRSIHEVPPRKNNPLKKKPKKREHVQNIPTPLPSYQKKGKKRTPQKKKHKGKELDMKREDRRGEKLTVPPYRREKDSHKKRTHMHPEKKKTPAPRQHLYLARSLLFLLHSFLFVLSGCRKIGRGKHPPRKEPTRKKWKKEKEQNADKRKEKKRERRGWAYMPLTHTHKKEARKNGGT